MLPPDVLVMKMENRARMTAAWARGEPVEFPCYELCLVEYAKVVYIGENIWGLVERKSGENLMVRLR